MNSDEVTPVLEFLFNHIHSSKKWESFFAVPFQFDDDYNHLNFFFEDFPNYPFTTFDEDYIDFTALIHALVSLGEFQSVFVSISPLSNLEDNIIGVKINIVDKYMKITIDKIKYILSAITKQNIEISDEQSQGSEGIIKVENKNELLVFSFDFDTFTINGYSSVPQGKKDTITISFLAKSNFLKKFYLFANKIMINMIYYPNKALNISLGSNSILLNIPTSQNRFSDLAEYLFPGSMKHIYSHTEKSEELNATSTATFVYLVKPINNSPTDTLNINSQQTQNDKQIDSIFMLFTFLNGIPQESNCNLSLELLSSITWSDLSISFIPMPLKSKINENESNDFIKNIENAKQIPYCTISSIIEKPGTVIMAFLNTTKESAKALSRIALTKAFEKMQYLFTKKKSYVRLNRIWESIDTISCSLSNICDDETVYQDAWNGCCSVLTEASKKPKNTQKLSDDESLNTEIDESNSMVLFE